MRYPSIDKFLGAESRVYQELGKGRRDYGLMGAEILLRRVETFWV